MELISLIYSVDELGALAIVALLIVALAMYRAHRNAAESFSLTDFITTNGKGDNAKLCQMGCFLVSSYVVFYMTIKGGLTEWAFWGYMGAWVGARGWSLMAAVKGQKTNGNGTHGVPAAPPPSTTSPT